MLSFIQLGLTRGTKLLLENVSLSIGHHSRVGLIGANGCGKSSLFGVILHKLDIAQGSIKLPNNTKIAYMSQDTPASTQTALEYTIDGDHELRNLQQQLVAAELKNEHELSFKLHARLEEIDAYSAPARAAVLLHGLGFKPHELSNSVTSFSGGWRVRLNLAQTLMMPSDLLLLDEPTNHLDLDAIIWLEKWLTQYQGTLFIISHDREFLDGCINHILHIEHQTMQLYSGNYSCFEQTRAANLARQQQLYEKQQQHITHLMSYVNRFKAKASKAAQAQSRLKAIQRLEIISAAHVDSPFNFEFKPALECASPLIRLEKAALGYDTTPLLTGIDFAIYQGARIGLLGPNGAGKSTFIKCLAGMLGILSGTLTTAPRNLRIGYFAQHQLEQLMMHASPLEHLKCVTKEMHLKDSSEQHMRNFLGGFAFHGAMAINPITNFSGGEKARLVLALLVWQQPNLLLLDEPTNHLDIEMRSALELALQSYAGAMVIISHDRYLLRSTVDEFYLIAQHTVQPFAGDIEAYASWINYAAQPPQQQTAKMQRLEQRRQVKIYENKVKKLENEIAKLQQQCHKIEASLAQDSIYAPAQHAMLQQLLQQQLHTRQLLEQHETEWLAIMQLLEDNTDVP